MPNFGLVTAGNLDGGGGVTATRGMSGTFPTISGATLQSVSLYMTDAGTFRAAVYQGGTSNSDMTGATLIEDLGEFTNSFAGSAFYTHAAAGTSVLPSNTRVWVVFKLDSTQIGWTTNSANSENWNASNGRVNVSGHTGGDTLANAFPATMDGSSSDSAFWYGTYLTYNEGSATFRRVYY